jgi:hypothetical protein
MQTDAVSLCREYRKNSLAFMDKYKDKSISVSGKIKQIHENQLGEGVIVLDGYGSGWSFKWDIVIVGWVQRSATHHHIIQILFRAVPLPLIAPSLGDRVLSLQTS